MLFYSALRHPGKLSFSFLAGTYCQRYEFVWICRKCGFLKTVPTTPFAVHLEKIRNHLH